MHIFHVNKLIYTKQFIEINKEIKNNSNKANKSYVNKI